MTNVKCIRCGALNVGAAQICKACELELNPVTPAFAAPIVYSSHPPNSDTGSVTINSIRPFKEVADVLGPTFNLFTQNFWLITKIAIVIVAPFEIFRTLNIDNLEYNWQLTVGTYFLDLMCGILIAPALIYALMQVMQTGTAPGINESYRSGFSKLGKLTVSAVLATILQAFGFVLCVIPGIIVGLALLLVYPIAILEKGSPTHALDSSYELTKGHRWKILGASIVIWLVMLLGSLPESAADYLGFGYTGFWPLHVLAAIFSDIVQQTTTILALVTYLSIRALWSQNPQ